MIQAISQPAWRRRWATPALLFGIVVLGVLYIGQVNAAAAMGYRLKDVETRIDNVRIANQQLEARVADRRAMANVARRVSILGMTRPSEVTYVSAAMPSVALR